MGAVLTMSHAKWKNALVGGRHCSTQSMTYTDMTRKSVPRHCHILQLALTRAESQFPITDRQKKKLIPTIASDNVLCP